VGQCPLRTLLCERRRGLYRDAVHMSVAALVVEFRPSARSVKVDVGAVAEVLRQSTWMSRCGSMGNSTQSRAKTAPATSTGRPEQLRTRGQRHRKAATTLSAQIFVVPTLRPFPPSLKFVNLAISCTASGNHCIKGEANASASRPTSSNRVHDNSHSSGYRIGSVHDNSVLQLWKCNNGGPIKALRFTTPAGVPISGPHEQCYACKREGEGCIG